MEIITDRDGIEKLGGDLIDYFNVRNEGSISDIYFLAKIKKARKDIKIYKPFSLNLDKKLFDKIEDLIVKYLEYELDMDINYISSVNLSSLILSVQFYSKGIPLYVPNRDILIKNINMFKEGDGFLGINNILLEKQTEIFGFKVKHIKKFSFYSPKSEIIEKLKESLPSQTIEIESSIASQLYLTPYRLVKNVGENMKGKGNFYEYNNDIKVNINRVIKGKNPIFKYDKNIEFNLIEAYIKRKEKMGEIEHIKHEFSFEDGGISCKAKDFFKALENMNLKESRKFRTLSLSEACAFRIKLTEKKIRSIMVPGEGFCVYYRYDYDVEEPTEDEINKFKASIIDVYSLNDYAHNKKLGELFKIKLINDKEVKDDFSIIGLYSDHNTLGLSSHSI